MIPQKQLHPKQAVQKQPLTARQMFEAKHAEKKKEKPKEKETAKEEGLTCDGCGKQIDSKEAKYVPKDSSTVLVLCKVCSGNSPAPKKVEEIKRKSKKVYKCKRCDYEFRFDPKGSAELKCPYCGRADRITEHIPAEEIIKGVKPEE